MSLYARKGEKIVCVEGHHIATFKKDVYRGAQVDPKAIKWSAIKAPRADETELPLCPTCQGVWSTGSLQLHLAEGGWR